MILGNFVVSQITYSLTKHVFMFSEHVKYIFNRDKQLITWKQDYFLLSEMNGVMSKELRSSYLL